eukprot:TRINITY_DN4446_c0_g1_i2.p1 TRINITY_DN4446_c0_g1~~TRINITY_DN4446_c0_g1_i2.p1  ORF type:complete len:735 (+),score=148.62 TRINITY_DN4446_c0_g1_i2:1822-4026(+)
MSYYNSQGSHIVGNQEGYALPPKDLQQNQPQPNANHFLYLFQQFDRDFDGYLSLDETRGLMWALFGNDPPRGVVDAFNEMLRVHQGDRLDYTTILSFYNRARNPPPPSTFVRPPSTQIPPVQPQLQPQIPPQVGQPYSQPLTHTVAQTQPYPQPKPQLQPQIQPQIPLQQPQVQSYSQPRPQPVAIPNPRPQPLAMPVVSNLPVIPISLPLQKPRSVINTNPEQPVSASSSSSVGTHYISKEEQRAFVEFINSHDKISQDKDLMNAGLVPINPDSKLYQNVSNGLLLCKLLNAIRAGTVPEAQIKKNPRTIFESTENQNLVILGAKKLGCSVVNIGPQDLIEGKPHLVLGLIWQVIKLDLLSKVSVQEHPELCQLISGGSNTLEPMSLQQMSQIAPEQVLLRWINHHLKNAGYNKTVSNFSNDIQDGSVYTVLMNQISNGHCSLDPLRETDIAKRLDMVWRNAQSLGCAKFVTPSDISSGNSKLNLAFVANLFNMHPGISLPSMEDLERLRQQNAQMASILSEAEARLRQLMADRQLAEELQNMEIQAARERELERQRQLELSEALAREEQQKENLSYQEKRRQKTEEIQKTSAFLQRENYSESQQRDYERKIIQDQQQNYLQQQRTNRYPVQTTTTTAAASRQATYSASSSYGNSSSSSYGNSYGSSYGAGPALTTRRDITQQSSYTYGPPLASDEFLEGPYYEGGDRRGVFERVGKRVDKKVTQIKDVHRYS